MKFEVGQLWMTEMYFRKILRIEDTKIYVKYTSVRNPKLSGEMYHHINSNLGILVPPLIEELL